MLLQTTRKFYENHKQLKTWETHSIIAYPVKGIVILYIYIIKVFYTYEWDVWENLMNEGNWNHMEAQGNMFPNKYHWI